MTRPCPVAKLTSKDKSESIAEKRCKTA